MFGRKEHNSRKSLCLAASDTCLGGLLLSNSISHRCKRLFLVWDWAETDLWQPLLTSVVIFPLSNPLPSALDCKGQALWSMSFETTSPSECNLSLFLFKETEWLEEKIATWFVPQTGQTCPLHSKTRWCPPLPS